MPVKLAVAIDRVQLFDTLNLSSQRDNLLTESSIYERQSTRYVECSEGRVSYEVLLGSLLGLGDIGVNQLGGRLSSACVVTLALMAVELILEIRLGHRAA
jgi:hypothetical protein